MSHASWNNRVRLVKPGSSVYMARRQPATSTAGDRPSAEPESPGAKDASSEEKNVAHEARFSPRA
jgi:hypothetical protein